jgi:hypothetical protein
MQVTNIGLDLGKHWFEVRGVNPIGVLTFFQSLAPCKGAAASCWQGRAVCSIIKA